jgi:hypothetical protein
MNRTNKLVLSILLGWTLTVAAVGQSNAVPGASSVSAAGVWVGKITIPTAAVKGQDAATKAKVENALTTMRKISIDLRLNSDKTFSWTYNGLPVDAGAPKSSLTVTGTWKQSASAVTLFSKTKGSKLPGTLTVQDEGRHMTMPLPTLPQGAVMIFTNTARS